MTKGQLEARLSEAISRFEIECMGRGPEKIRTTILGDMIIVRQQGFLSKAEKNLALTREGVERIKGLRTALFENARQNLVETVNDVVSGTVVSTFSDVSTRTGEKIVVIIMDRNIEEQIR